MPEDTRLALRQADQARTDFAIIEDNLEAICSRLVCVPTRGDLARTGLMGMIGEAGLVILWFEAFGGHCGVA